MKRLYTSAVLLLCGALLFFTRFYMIWIFDATVLFVALFAVWEVMKVRQSAAKGVSFIYMLAYVATAYAMYIICEISNFELWLHAIIQIVVVFIFAFYTFLMCFMDDELAQTAKVEKKNGSIAGTGAKEFLYLVFYPLMFAFAFILLNHLGTYYMWYKGFDVWLLPIFALVLTISITVFTDTCAYFTGRIIGGKKLCPKISPKKTISGAIGGLFGGVTASLLTILCMVNGAYGYGLQHFCTENMGDVVMVQIIFVIIGIIGSIATQAGDLYASWVKRRAGVKDYGNVLSGHGGVMDRIDGLLFNGLFITILFFVLVIL